MIPDDTLLQNVGMSKHLLNTIRNIIAYHPKFEGNRSMTFGNAKRIDEVEIMLSPYTTESTVTEWHIYLSAVNGRFAQKEVEKHLLIRDIAHREKHIAALEKSIRTQKRNLEDKRRELKRMETSDDRS